MMYHQNNTDQTDDDLRLQYPSYKMLDSLVQSRKLWSTDGQHFFLLMNTGYGTQEVAACVCVNSIPNSYLPIEITEKHTVHIQYVCTRNDWRNCGFLGVVMQYLIEAAEEYGVFLHLHARPFEIELPQISNPEELEKWVEQDLGTHNPSLKKDKQNAKLMKRVYLGMGFCRYDGVGVRFGNRYWKKMCCGFRSSKITNPILNRYLDQHLHC